MNCPYVVLVVVFKRGLEDSQTLMALREQQGLFPGAVLHVWDNSPQPFLHLDMLKEAFPALRLEYTHTPENYPLSRIYNSIIDEYRHTGRYLVLLDHDTELTSDYWKEANELTQNSSEKKNLILPVIIAGDRIVSPAKLYHFLGRHFQAAPSGDIPSRYLSAINSGMIISLDYFQRSGFRYDERLRFYGTDDYFMKEFQRKEERCFVMTARLYHSLDYFSDRETVDQKVHRFAEIVSGILLLNRANPFIALGARAYVFSKALRESLKHRTLKFLAAGWRSL
ncbi:hypothetical protein ACWKWU_17710 [Chitinophaga lutea]